MSRRAWRLALALVLSTAAAAWSAPAAPGKRGRVVPPPHSVSRDNLERVRARLASGAGLAPRKAAADSVRFVALRIEFPDLAFGSSPPADELHDRFYYENQFHYVEQYYDAASIGRLHVRVDVADLVVQAARSQADYGDVAAYDSSMVALTAEAVRAADPSVDFAAYDGVLLIHAGPGQESDVLGDSETQIWSGFIDDGTFREQLSRPDSVVRGIATGDGVQVSNVVVLPEWEVQDLQATGGTRLGSLGVTCHEFGQRLGMLPLFDASPRVPDSQGLGNFDVMGYGLWVANGFIPSLPSSFNRLLMGWLQPVEVHASNPGIVLRDQERGAADSTVARVWISTREYFLVSYVLEDPDGPVTKLCNGTPDGPRRFFEFEDQNSNCRFDYTDVNGDGVLSAGDLIDSYAGAEWDFFMTDFQGGSTAGQGSGLLILHVDEQVLQEVLARGSTNVEGDPRRKAVDVEEADGIEDLDRAADNARAFGSADDYWTELQAFSPRSVPDTRSANGAPTGIEIVEGPPNPSPGTRAVQISVQFGPVGQGGAPARVATRSFAGRVGSDVVTLFAGGPIVIPADSGQVLLADGLLDEWPASDGDPATLRPWVTVPPALRAPWIGSPVSGLIDDSSARRGIVFSAGADSAGVARTRVFAWDDLGREVRDLDANPGTNTGLFATLPGRGAPPVLIDLGGSTVSSVCVGSQIGDSTRITEFTSQQTGWVVRAVTSRGRLCGGPIGTRVDMGGVPTAAVAWAVADSVAEQLVLHVQPGRDGVVGRLPLDGPAPRGPVRLVAANLDGRDAEEIVIASPERGLEVFDLDPTFAGGWHLVPRGHADLPGQSLTPLALADLDGNGTREILVATESAMHALSFTGAELPGWPYAFQLEPGLAPEPQPGRDAGSPLVGNLDGDSAPEILLHLPGGALLVWNAGGQRRRDLEAALPARGAFTPRLGSVVGILDTPMVAIGQFDAADGYLAPQESLLVRPRSEIAVWKFPEAGSIAWGELGGGSDHAFHDATARELQVAPNDPGLPSFVVGPNPAESEVRARVTLTESTTARCRLFNLEGEIVRDANQSGAAGSIVEFVFDVRELASGVYLAQLELATGGRRTRPVAVRR